LSTYNNIVLNVSVTVSVGPGCVLAYAVADSHLVTLLQTAAYSSLLKADLYDLL